MENAKIMKNDLVWAFDIGTGSIGEAVRRGTEFLHKESLLIPHDFAGTKTAATRRRMMRTRLAHKAREEWLRIIWKTAGLEPLYGREVGKVDQNHNVIDPKDYKRIKGEWTLIKEGDSKLEREFAAPGDTTCYTSCLLRIKLLKGEKLQDWQIFKALHSAIQKRGYGKVAWAAKEALRVGKTPDEIETEEQKKLKKADSKYKETCSAWGKFKKSLPSEQFAYPCYFDAFKMKLWNTSSPNVLLDRVDCNAESTRNIRFDRNDIAKEVKALAEQAAKQIALLQSLFDKVKKDGWAQGVDHFPVLAENFADFLAYGPAGEPEASYYPELRKKSKLHMGSDDDWMGVLGQKIPRFDNRIINNCSLITRLQVCKCDIRQDSKTKKPAEESLLPSEVTFLMKLKNIRVQRCGQQTGLTADEIKYIFEEKRNLALEYSKESKDWAKSITDCFKLTQKEWEKVGKKSEMAFRPLPNHEKVAPPKHTGRARFSRPALRLLKSLILSGKSPKTLHHEESLKLKENNDPKKGLIPNDLSFLLKMGDAWEKIYIPEQKLDALEKAYQNPDGTLDKQKAIRAIIGSINNPIVRHRLTVFSDRLSFLTNNHGIPDQVVLEFVREDFMGDDAKRELKKFQDDRKKQRIEARKFANDAGDTSKGGALRYELWKAQGGNCLYTGDTLEVTNLQNYHIDHIVPRAQGGPDALLNYILTTNEANKLKGKQTPYEWLHKTEGWDAYTNRVKARATLLRNKKVQLLINENSPELVERYTSLAETAWISKLAQKIASIHFGWKNGIDDQNKKRITVVSGGLTSRIRRRYKLNHILNPDAKTDEEAEKKNRIDDRHHALDAMVISFIPQWTRDEQKEHFFRFPGEIQKNAKVFFEMQIHSIVPRNLFLEKPQLAETIYGVRKSKEGETIVQRVEIENLGMKPIGMNKVTFNLEYTQKQIKSVRDKRIKELLSEFLKTEPDEQRWKSFCATFRLTSKDGKDCSLVSHITVNVGPTDEYKDLSKDKTGALVKAKKGHKGQIIYLNENQKPHVRPIYVFESAKIVSDELSKNIGLSNIFGFFQSDCMVEICKEMPMESYNIVVLNDEKKKRRIKADSTLLPQKLILNTIITNGLVAEMTTSDSQRIVVKLSELIKYGFRRAD